MLMMKQSVFSTLFHFLAELKGRWTNLEYLCGGLCGTHAWNDGSKISSKGSKSISELDDAVRLSRPSSVGEKHAKLTERIYCNHVIIVERLWDLLEKDP